MFTLYSMMSWMRVVNEDGMRPVLIAVEDIQVRHFIFEPGSGMFKIVLASRLIPLLLLYSASLSDNHPSLPGL